MHTYMYIVYMYVYTHTLLHVHVRVQHLHVSFSVFVFVCSFVCELGLTRVNSCTEITVDVHVCMNKYVRSNAAALRTVHLLR